MSYSTLTDIQGEFRSIQFTASSAVTDSKVISFIKQADQYIDAKLSKKYVTPITGTNSLVIINQISTFLVTQRVRNILEVKTAVSDVQQATRSVDLNKMAEQMLKDIIESVIILPDAVLQSGHGGVDSFNASSPECVPNQFQYGRNQW